jgi:hypothetical protein
MATALQPVGTTIARPQTWRPRRALVRRTVTAWRLRHPELRAAITLAGLCAAMARDRIRYSPTLNDDTFYLGRLLDSERLNLSVVLVSERLSGAGQLLVIAHELGHRALHSRCATMLPAYVAESRARTYCYQRAGTWYTRMNDGPIWRMIEAEADLFADLLLGNELATAGRREICSMREPER